VSLIEISKIGLCCQFGYPQSMQFNENLDAINTAPTTKPLTPTVKLLPQHTIDAAVPSSISSRLV